MESKALKKTLATIRNAYESDYAKEFMAFARIAPTAAHKLARVLLDETDSEGRFVRGELSREAIQDAEEALKSAAYKRGAEDRA